MGRFSFELWHFWGQTEIKTVLMQLRLKILDREPSISKMSLSGTVLANVAVKWAAVDSVVHCRLWWLEKQWMFVWSWIAFNFVVWHHFCMCLVWCCCGWLNMVQSFAVLSINMQLFNDTRCSSSLRCSSLKTFHIYNDCKTNESNMKQALHLLHDSKAETYSITKPIPIF